MRTLVDKVLLPGVWGEPEAGFVAGDREQQRWNVFLGETYIGQVSYLRRRRATGGSDYGWLPTEKISTARRLTTKVEAIRRLPRWELSR